MRRVTVVTAAHLSTCPRMVKAADALQDAGYDVRVVSVTSTEWATAADPELHRTRKWRWTAVDGRRATVPVRWLTRGARFRAARTMAPHVSGAAGSWLAPYALSRMHGDLVRAVLAEPSDVIYSGTSGAMAVALDASRRSGVPCGIDFEDFHCGEQEAGAAGAAIDAIAAVVMAEASRDAAFLTAGSDAIAAACEARFGRRPVAIHNVFPLPKSAPSGERPDGPLRLYWFSQTVGPYRGIEDAVLAAGRAGIDCELHLRGVGVPGYLDGLERLASAQAPRLAIVRHAPAAPDTMIDACRRFDVGLATEQGHIPNRALALTNKALTYPLAGLAMAMTDTPGQRALARDAGEGAVVYAPGDIEILADGLARWAGDTSRLRMAQEASWHAGRRRWHWEHRDERDALVDAVRQAI